MRTYRGIAASPGIAFGPVRLVERRRVEVIERSIPEAAAGREVERFRAAVAASRTELEAVVQGLAPNSGEPGAGERRAILEAHLLFLDDPALVDETESRIRGRLRNAEFLLAEVAAEQAATLAALDDPYFAARAADVRDVGDRILRNLAGVGEPGAADGGDQPRVPVAGAGEPGASVPAIIFAHDLAPSDTAQLDRRAVAAFVTEAGGLTSHTAILARSMEIPAVVGAGEFLNQVTTGASAIVDGTAGAVVIDPDQDTLADYRRRAVEAASGRARLEALRDLPAVSTDGRVVELAANIGEPREAARALELGAEGVGLFRTEFLFLDRTNLPGEDEQYEAYRAVAEAFGQRPVIIRTLDIGGDKEVPALGLPREANPFLGWRALRISLERRDLFRTQLRALWRAAAHGNLKVMFPMVTTVEELRLAKAALAEVARELAAEGKLGAQRLPAGIMVETPAAAALADILAREAAFFSLGTNDLAQYTLAVDRGNEKVAHLYDPLHPAVLRLIAKTVEAARAAGIWCGMCGQMAGDPAAAPFLLGIGLDELSMSPTSIPEVKEAIRGLSAARAAEAAGKALAAESADEARKALALSKA